MAVDGKINLGIETDLDQATRDIEGFSKRATMSLMSLSQVIQDLPYGFIGIQNNIPILTQQFGTLVQESGGFASALKALGSSLISPTGLVFGISALTSGITYLVQQYGSLGNAFDAVFNSSKRLTDQQKKIVDSIASESTEVLTLYGLYKNLNDSKEKQSQILDVLNKKNSEYFGNLKNQTNQTEALQLATDKYISSLLGKLFVETQQAKVTEILKKYGEQLTFLVDNEIRVSEQREKDKNKLKDFIALTERLGKSQSNLTETTVGIKPVVVKKTTEEELKRLSDALKLDIEKLFSATSKFKNVLNINDIFGFKPKDVEKTVQDLRDPIKRAGFVEDVKILTKDTKLKLFDNIIDGTQHIVDIMMQFDMQQFINKFNAAQETVRSIFFDPLQQLFVNLVTNGKNAFKEFTKAVLTSISQIVAKIIATKIVTLLADILAPGSGALVRIGLKSVSTNALGDFLNMSPGAANFGGVQGGSMGMSGSVNLTLRGTDLVGAINRTNSQINRVG